MITQCVYGPIVPQQVICELIGGGVPERYPDLHFALIEFNAHWLASLVGSMDKCWVTGIGQDADWWLGHWDDTRPADDQPNMAQLFRLNEKWPYPLDAERVRPAPVPRLVPGRPRRRRLPAHHRAVDDRVGQRLPARRRDVPREPGADREAVRRCPGRRAGRHARRHPRRSPGVRGPGGRLNEHRFDGRVAVVTGAGRGIGRAHALLLADRGASVVVNDLGGSMDGVGADAEPASTVAAEIVAAGGAAIADTSDVATAAGAQALVDAAVERFGRLDILVNNAGIIRWAGFPDADADNLARHLAVHVGGSFNTARAAWPHMVEQGYGRIVMTTSVGDVRAARTTSRTPPPRPRVIGLTRSLTTAGAAHGIKVNLIAPGGVHPHGRRGARRLPSDQMSPDLVAPMVAFLAHEDCPVSGEIYAAGAGRFARIFIASTEGYVHAEAGADDRGRRRRTGRRSTTRPTTTSPPTSPTGPPSSWRICSRAAQNPDGTSRSRGSCGRSAHWDRSLPRARRCPRG